MSGNRTNGAAIILAAGRSARMGRPKALLPCHGTTFVETIHRTLNDAAVAHVRVVVGHQAKAVMDGTSLPRAVFVYNSHHDLGMLSSVRAGIAALPPEIDYFLLWPVDHPLVEAETVRKLIDARRRTARRIALPLHHGERGHPVLFAADLAPEIVGAPDSEGARFVVHRHERDIEGVAVTDPGVVADIDNPDDFHRFLGEPHES